MTRRIDGILFDLGETLLHYGDVDVLDMFRQGGQLAFEYLRELGKDLTSFDTFHRQQRRAIRWTYFKSLLTRREFSSIRIMEDYCRRRGYDLTREQLVELAWKWYEPLSRCATVEPGTREMLADFRERGLTLGLASNTFVPPEVLDRHLEMEGLLEFLDARVYSCEVGRRKPNRRVFEAALQKAGLQAERTIFVGDSPRADVRGGHRAGCITVLTDPHGRHRRTTVHPDYRIGAITDLRAVVDEFDTPA